MKLDKGQIEAINKMKSGSILCGGVGSGKSLTALGYFAKKIKDKKIIIITTARKRDTLEWEKELLIFNLSATVDSWNNIKKYTHLENCFFIFDEQRLVGYGAWVKSFFKIAKNNQWVLLTATPGDTWLEYMPIFIANGFYKNKTDFENTHVLYNWGNKFKTVARYIGVNKLIENKNKIIIYMSYTSTVIKESEFIKTKYDKNTYKYLLKKRWNVWEDKPIENISELCYYLRMVSNIDLSKLEELNNIILKHKRVIVFYNYNYELKLLKEFLEKNQYLYNEWNGHKHERLNENNTTYVYLVQYISGAEGWNCITSDTITFFSLNYSYKLMTQAAGRIDRRNTPFKKIYYYYLISDSLIDKAILKAIENKKNFNIRNFITS